MNRKKGFTLIELLVVISIIALLMGILLPALSKAREMAKRAVCGSQVKQIGTALMSYIGDYDDSMPWNGVYQSGANDKEETHPYAVYRTNHTDIDDQKYQDSETACDCGQMGKPIPMKLACLFDRGYVGDGKIFYCPSNINPDDRYESYCKSTIPGISNTWGKPHQRINEGKENDWIRIGYSYYPMDETLRVGGTDFTTDDTFGFLIPRKTARKYTVLSKKYPYVTDVMWTSRKSLSHKAGVDSGTNVPKSAGVNALFKDGHVVFVKDQKVRYKWGALMTDGMLFDNEYWNKCDPVGGVKKGKEPDSRAIIYNIFKMIEFQNN